MQGSVIGIFVSGNYAFVPSWDHGFRIVNISNLNYPAIITSVATPHNASEVFIFGNHAYIADGMWGGDLEIIEIFK